MCVFFVVGEREAWWRHYYGFVNIYPMTRCFWRGSCKDRYGGPVEVILVPAGLSRNLRLGHILRSADSSTPGAPGADARCPWPPHYSTSRSNILEDASSFVSSCASFRSSLFPSWVVTRTFQSRVDIPQAICQIIMLWTYWC